MKEQTSYDESMVVVKINVGGCWGLELCRTLDTAVVDTGKVVYSVYNVPYIHTHSQSSI